MSDKDEWLTPEPIIEAVKIAFRGTITLDPCAETPLDGQPYNVPALFHYTKADNGLAQKWSGNVWVNPPYSKAGRPGDWCEKAVEAVTRYPSTQVIMLLPARTDTTWIRPLDPYPRVHIHGRIRFKVGTPGQTDYGCGMFPSIVVSLNVPVRQMYWAFSSMGTLYVPFDPDR